MFTKKMFSMAVFFVCTVYVSQSVYGASSTKVVALNKRLEACIISKPLPHPGLRKTPFGIALADLLKNIAIPKTVITDIQFITTVASNKKLWPMMHLPIQAFYRQSTVPVKRALKTLLDMHEMGDLITNAYPSVESCTSFTHFCRPLAKKKATLG